MKIDTPNTASVIKLLRAIAASSSAKEAGHNLIMTLAADTLQAAVDNERAILIALELAPYKDPSGTGEIGWNNAIERIEEVVKQNNA
jgi:hypothetical protein